MKVPLVQTMPGLDATARDQLLLHQCLSRLPSSVSQQLRASGEANSQVRAIERARLLMLLDNECLPVAALAPTPDFLQGQIEKLNEQVAALSTQVLNGQRKSKHCYNCGQTGHIQRDSFYQDPTSDAFYAINLGILPSTAGGIRCL